MFKLNISKYLIAIIIFLGWFHLALANFEITEIMYDASGTDTDREWIEVENTGTDAADLSKWYFFSGNSKHALTPIDTPNVPAGGFAVIAQNVNKFKVDWPNYTGLLFDSSWTGLNNEAGTVALKDPDLNTVSEVTYNSAMGANGDGNSLQNINGSWVAALPTPGQANVSTPAQNNTPGVSGGSSIVASSGSTVVVPKKEIELPKITTDIIANNIAIANIPISIDSHTLGLNKENMTRGKFVWNFGDGYSREDSTAQKFSYTYVYPGEYLLTLTYYQNYYRPSPDATDRLIIKVLPPEISISSVGTPTEPFVELESKSSYETNLSGWVLKGVKHKFYFPDGTIILPGKKLKLSSLVTSFDKDDISSVSLQNQNGVIFANYPIIQNQDVKVVPVTPVKNKISSSNVLSVKVKSPDQNTIVQPEVINLDTLEANTANADNKGLNVGILYLFGLLVIIVAGISSVLLIRRKRGPSDYLDKEIRAEDMTIVE